MNNIYLTGKMLFYSFWKALYYWPHLMGTKIPKPILLPYFDNKEPYAVNSSVWRRGKKNPRIVPSLGGRDPTFSEI